MSELSLRRSLRQQQIFSRERYQQSTANVDFQIPELLAEIVNHCPWASRVNLSHTTVRARLVVQTVIRRRIRGLLAPFIDNLSAFFSLLHEIRAAVVGSVAWNVMTVDLLHPRDLNIVVPNGSVYGVERMKALLSCSGTTVTFDRSPGIVYEGCASRLIRLMGKMVGLSFRHLFPRCLNRLCRVRQ